MPTAYFRFRYIDLAFNAVGADFDPALKPEKLAGNLAVQNKIRTCICLNY